MLEPCSIEMYKSLSRTQCHCCKKNFCRSHFIEHDNLPNLQLNSLGDEINLLNDRVTALNSDQLTNDSRQKLERWRINCHTMIDDIIEEKCREIDQRANETLQRQQDEIHKIRSTFTEIVRKQETTMKDIDLLKVAIHILEETCLEVVIRPLTVDSYNLIYIKEQYAPQLDLSILPVPYKTMNLISSNGSLAFAINDQFFLIHQTPNLCLMDEDFRVVETSQWNHNLIWDMCWSSMLARFFVMTETNVFIVDDNTMSIERLHINQNQKWCSCTCSDTALYLLTLNRGPSILKFSPFPFIQFEKQWTLPETCVPHQGIINIACNSEMLALMIANPETEEKLTELRSSITVERLWSLKLDIESNNGLACCCFLNHGDWLVWDVITSSLLHITKSGKAQAKTKYNEHPISVNLSDGNKLIILTDKSINYHELKSVN